MPVIGRLAGLPEQATWGEWIASLADLAGFTLREPERVIELLDELDPMADISGPAGRRTSGSTAASTRHPE